MRVLFVSFVQGLFHAAQRGYLHWEPDLERTEIIITDENPVDIDVAGIRPAISFTRGPVQYNSIALDDMMEFDLETGAKTKTAILPGTMNINCCSKSDIESERIASIVAEQLWMHREMLLKQGLFEAGRQPLIGSPSPAGSIVSGDNGHEWYVTTVSSPFQLYRTNKATPLNVHIARSIEMRVQTALQKLQAGNWPSAGGSPEAPYQVNAAYPPNFSPASDVQGGTARPGVAPSSFLAPHPLNPAKIVQVRSVRPNRPGIRPPSIGGRVLPIQETSVEESTQPVTVRVKI